MFVSAATAWEIAIKQAMGKLSFPMARFGESLAESGFIPLAIEIPHAILAGALPRHHADPLIRSYAVAVLDG
ncbi:MAG: hypothetical protein Q7R40_14950 [Phaeospirillum sp.]|nr:hypothetical protein [Phaeospirillum sp.]